MFGMQAMHGRTGWKRIWNGVEWIAVTPVVTSQYSLATIEGPTHVGYETRKHHRYNQCVHRSVIYTSQWLVVREHQRRMWVKGSPDAKRATMAFANR